MILGRATLRVPLWPALAVAAALLASPVAANAAAPLKWSGPEMIDPGQTIDAVSCPTTTLCVAVDGAGAVLWSTDPAGGASTWHRNALAVPSGAQLESISCPSTTLCVAGGGSGTETSATLAVATDPTGGAGAWSVEAVGGQDVIWGQGLGNGLSCAVGPVCVALDQFTTPPAVATTDPTGGAGAWSPISPFGAGVVANAVSCPSASLCVAVANAGVAFFSTDPDSNSWTEVPGIDTSPGILGGQINAISCPTTALCVGVDQIGYVVSTTDPTGGPSAWQMTTAAISDSQLLHVSCAPGPLCVALDFAGDVYTSGDPTGGVGAWSQTADVDSALDGVSCASTSLCVGVDTNGAVVVGTGPGPIPPPPAPIASRASLRGLGSGKPKLTFTLSAGSTAPNLSKLVLSPHSGLGFASRAARLGDGVTVKRPSGRRLRFTASVQRGALAISLKSPAAAVAVTVSSPAITADRALQRKVHDHAPASIDLGLSAADTAGNVWTLTLKLRV